MVKYKYSVFIFLAPVVQWIEQGSSKALMGVRFPPGAKSKLARNTVPIVQWQNTALWQQLREFDPLWAPQQKTRHKTSFSVILKPHDDQKISTHYLATLRTIRT